MWLLPDSDFESESIVALVWIESSLFADRALEDLLDTLPPMPSLPDKALSRESIYAAEDDIR
jgi:hypothetical protein